MSDRIPSYFISYEYYDSLDKNKTIKTDSFITTDGALYLSKGDLDVLSTEILRNAYRIVTKYINVNRLDKCK